MTKNRRPIHLHVMVSEEELALIRARMAEAGVHNMGAYVRKMAMNGYVLHVDLGPVREQVSLQRRCSNNLNQVEIQANTYGGIYPQDIAMLQKDYAELWGPLSELLKLLSKVIERRRSLAGSAFLFIYQVLIVCYHSVEVPVAQHVYLFLQHPILWRYWELHFSL